MMGFLVGLAVHEVNVLRGRNGDRRRVLSGGLVFAAVVQRAGQSRSSRFPAGDG
jgi:hypothetical protein